MSSTKGKKRVVFAQKAPSGSQVTVAGSFNGWNTKSHRLAEKEPGSYSRTVYLAPGEYEYKFLVEGKWVLDSQAVWRLNDYSSANSVLTVGLRSGPSITSGTTRLPSELSDDSLLSPYRSVIERRRTRMLELEKTLRRGNKSLARSLSGENHYGLHRTKSHWVFREWAPGATSLTLLGDFCDWDVGKGIPLARQEGGEWSAQIPLSLLQHGQNYCLRVKWPGGEGDRLPSHARRLVQDEKSKIFSAQVWDPDQPFVWQHDAPTLEKRALMIYECHVGMALEEERVGTFPEFVEQIIPRIVTAGYNAIQLMGIMEHPYYGSFGYHVTNFFGVSSRFGTPEEFKALVDAAHGAGLLVIMDLVHSHSAKNENEGLSRFDGTAYQYFHDGPRGDHQAWDSRCFNYAKPEVLQFLLSNCRYWLEEYRVDGFRFDGVTSMLYLHHGLGAEFDSYDRYFDGYVDEDAYAYLGLANKVIHEINPDAITIAEDVSGMPGLGADQQEGGCGFDYRLAMGVADYWFRLCDIRDEDWDVEQLWHVLRDGRRDERRISYVESHDQSLVGGKTLIFQLIDAAMYEGMSNQTQNLAVERGVALHKLARLATAATADGGYLNFMGNEFGHPEWVDFPREGNGWSYQFARRQWSLRDNEDLRYHGLAEFDRSMLTTLAHYQILSQPLQLRQTHARDQILVFSRGCLLFAFNFHPTQSQMLRAIPVEGTSLELVLDSDAPQFAGQGQVQRPPHERPVEGIVEIRLPARSAVIYRETV